MAISKEVLDELLKDYKGPDDITGPEGLLKKLTKALIERAMDAEMTTHLGYEKHDQAKKDTTNRRNGKTRKTLRSDQGPLEIEVPRDREGNSSQQSSQNINVNSRALTIKSCQCMPEE